LLVRISPSALRITPVPSPPLPSGARSSIETTLGSSRDATCSTASGLVFTLVTGALSAVEPAEVLSSSWWVITAPPPPPMRPAARATATSVVTPRRRRDWSG